MNIKKESFASLFEETLGENKNIVGTVVKGTIISINDDMVLVDVGLKSEGRINIREFAISGDIPELNAGDEIDVFVERMEDRNGEVGLSRERAKREEAWIKVAELFKNGEKVEGVIFERVRGGFKVDVLGCMAFLPGSQVDVRPIRDMEPLMNKKLSFEVLKMDKERGNIVVSRRAILEEVSAEERSKIMENLKEGDEVEGIVKNITDYGAFVDLGGIDGLLHVTDISWKRVNHPSEALKVGQTIKAKIIRFNQETKRISLGIKQMSDDPWLEAAAKYKVGSRFVGKITNIAEYGAFVQLEEGIEGLVHVSEMSWTKKNVQPGKVVSTSQEVEVQVLEVEAEKRRISLGLKQCQENPWSTIAQQYPIGTVIESDIKNVTEFGMFVGISEDIDGMVHMSDISWEKSGEEAIADFKKGDVVKAVVLDMDVEKERISLGIKQLTDNPNPSSNKAGSFDIEGVKKNDVVTVVITEINDGGLKVLVNEKIPGFIKKSDLSRERSEQRTDRFATGEKVDAMVLSVSRREQRLNLSIKALETQQEKEAMEQYGSADSGATLGDILGKVLKDKKK
ncbi:MAG: 30S ribosomal protein S1 [Alphaproteobacteria bacterium]|nr:30S ribosomal protein S1 [Alphaproteobacteria bacterium]